MAKGGKRFMVVSRGGESTRFFEVTVRKLKKSKPAAMDTTAPVVDVPQHPPPATPVTEETCEVQSRSTVLMCISVLMLLV